MRNFFLSTVLILFFCTSSSAEIKELDDSSFNSHRHGIANAGGRSGIATVCIDGYVFVSYYDYSYGHGNDGGNSSAVSLVQFFEDRGGKSLPKKC